MLSSFTESLLQKVATELAFLLPGRNQGMTEIAGWMAQLAKAVEGLQSSVVQQTIKKCQLLCQKAVLNNCGLTSSELERLQVDFEDLSSTLYLASSKDSETAVPLCDLSALANEEALVLSPDADAELLNEFCTEGRDLLHQIEQGVLVLEENPGHKDTLNQVFRAFHTFKGGAGFLGIAPVQRLAHELESVLDAARQNQLAINRDVIDLILAGGDALRHYVDAIVLQLHGDGRGQAIVVPTADLVARATACLQGKPFAVAGAQDVMVPLAVTVQVSDVSMRKPGPSVQPIGSAELDLRAMSGSASTAVPSQAIARTVPLAEYVKLDTRKLDALVDFVGELVIAQSMVLQHPKLLAPQDRDLERHLRQLTCITTDLQRNAMSLRMVSVRSVMEKMTRLVRDLASAQNKQIQLHLSGEDTELDRKVVEEMADPLLHMMRNAVDHGIELPADRVAQGKSAQGNIHLQALHQGGGILIRIHDDGKGLDSGKIHKKALARGLVLQGSVLSEKEIYKLIFSPGFSTADSVTEISGRGVGMDVVHGSINKLRGRVDIESVRGQGTKFNIFLPLTLAIIDAMLVGVGNERFIVPTLVVRESLRPQPSMVFTVQGRGEVISVRGKLIPLVRLADKLDLPCVAQEPCDGIVVVVDSGGGSRALLVDRLIGKQEVVIKSLGETFKHQKNFSGAAILGDGRVALIIDPDAIGRWSAKVPLPA